MREGLLVVLVGAALAVPVAAAAAPPLPGLQHSPPIFMDEATPFVQLMNQSNGYWFMVHAQVAGMPPKSPVRLDWTSGGKVVASIKCDLHQGIYRDTIGVQCDYRDKPLKAAGAINAKLIVTDDADDKEYLIRDLKVNATPYRGDANGPIWQIVPDDVLGAGYAVHIHTGEQTAREGEIGFNFWISGPLQHPQGQLRCSIDGKQLQDDFEGEFEDMGHGEEEEISTKIIPKHGKATYYYWKHVQFLVGQLYFGKDKHGDHFVLGDHPGAWSCDLRLDHQVLRTFVFTVDDKGRIQSGAMQQAKDSPPLPADVAWIEMRFPKSNSVDTRIRPAAMKHSRGFGLPWPSDPSVKALHAMFPASVGRGEP